MSEIVIEGLENIGAETKSFVSLGTGLATAAANLGVNDRRFKKHKRWSQKKLKKDIFTKVLKRN